MNRFKFLILVTFFTGSRLFASDCPEWLPANAGFDGKALCKVASPAKGASVGQAVVYGIARDDNKEKLAGVSLVLVEWSGTSRQLRLVDRISGLGESMLPFVFKKQEHYFYEIKAKQTSYYLLRSLSDQVALMLTVIIDQGRFQVLSVKERGGLVRDALVGNVEGIPEVYGDAKFPLYIKVPVESGHRTYFLTGRQFVSR